MTNMYWQLIHRHRKVLIIRSVRYSVAVRCVNTNTYTNTVRWVRSTMRCARAKRAPPPPPLSSHRWNVYTMTILGWAVLNDFKVKRIA